MPMSSQWTQSPVYGYQGGSRSVVPVVNQQQIVPQRSDMYYMNTVPAQQSTQMMSYSTGGQQMTSMDSAVYGRYVSRPPQDVEYTMGQTGATTTSFGNYPVDGWNGMWRQTSRAYKENQVQQPPVQQVQQFQQQQMYVNPAPQMVSSGMYQQSMPMMGYGGGGGCPCAHGR